MSRAIEGVGGGNLGVAQSYIADVTTEDERANAYAVGAAAFGLGLVAGPVLAGQLVPANTELPFFIPAALQAANMLLTTFALASTKAPRATASSLPLADAVRTSARRNLLAREFCYIFAFTYFFTLFSLYLARELRMPPEESSLFLALAGGVGAAVQLLGVERLTRRIGSYALSQASFALGSIAYAAMFFIGENIAVFVVVLVLWAVSGSVLRPTLTTLLSDAAPDDRRGAVLGVADALDNASMIVAPTAAGAILTIGPAYVGILPAVALAAGFVLGIRGRRRTIATR